MHTYHQEYQTNVSLFAHQNQPISQLAAYVKF